LVLYGPSTPDVSSVAKENVAVPPIALTRSAERANMTFPNPSSIVQMSAPPVRLSGVLSATKQIIATTPVDPLGNSRGCMNAAATLGSAPFSKTPNSVGRTITESLYLDMPQYVSR
jgi:hypothetical protein